MSSWIDYVERSDDSWYEDGEEMVIATVCYTNQQGYSNGDLYFWVSLSDYESLEGASSQGSEYWHNWKEGGMEHHYGQEGDTISYEDYENYDEEEDGDFDDYVNNNAGGYSGGSSSYSSSGSSGGGSTSVSYDDDYDDGGSYEVEDVKENISPSYNKPKPRIDGNILREAREARNNGEFDEWLARNEDRIDNNAKETIIKVGERFESAISLMEKTEELRNLIQREMLTGKKMWKVIFRDVEDFMGVHIKNRVKFAILNNIGVGKLNPAMFIKYKMKVKNFYELLEKEGIEGAAKIGKRWASAKNPLIRNRYAYKGKEAIKQAYKNKYKGWYEGNEAVEQIIRFNKKVMKEEAAGIIKRNSFKLEQRYVMRKGKKVLQVHWRRDVSVGRKVITKSKKAVRLAKWVFVAIV